MHKILRKSLSNQVHAIFLHLGSSIYNTRELKDEIFNENVWTLLVQLTHLATITFKTFH